MSKLRITKKQVKLIASGEVNIKDVFPHVFVNFTGWAVDDDHPNWIAYFKEDGSMYGISDTQKWFIAHNEPLELRDNEHPATKEEVAERLINYAKEQGYIYEVYKYRELDNQLIGKTKNKSSEIIFNNGEWLPKLNQIEVNAPELVDTTDYKVKYFETCIEIEKFKQIEQLKPLLEKLLKNNMCSHEGDKLIVKALKSF